MTTNPKGAGRKPGSTKDRAKLGISISRENAEWLREKKAQNHNISDIIDRAVSRVRRPRKFLTMFDNNTSAPLTGEERKQVVLGCMTVLISDDGDLSDLGLLLSRFEETCRDREKSVCKLIAVLDNVTGWLETLKQETDWDSEGAVSEVLGEILQARKEG